MSELADAEKAICQAIILAADGEVDSEKLERMANAVSHLKFGPQGGAMERSDDYHYTADYHYTEHDRDRRARPTGFVDRQPRAD